MKEWIFKYWIEVFFGFIAAGLTVGYKKLASKIKEQDAIRLGIQVLLKDRIIEGYNNCIEKGYCPIHALENVNTLYKQYHALGGNETITELVEKLKDLPTEKRKE